jgi:anti-sigma factor ChrR (cupin superfamily)
MYFQQHIVYEKLVAYAADELNQGEARAVASHAENCAECSQTVNFLKSLRR